MWETTANAPMVSLDLTNEAPLAETIVPLFNTGEADLAGGLTPTGTESILAVVAANFAFPSPWIISYTENGVSKTHTITSAVANFTDLLNELNAFFTQNNRGIFWAEPDIILPSDADLIAASSKYVFVSATDPSSVVIPFTTGDSGFVAGTSARVTVVSGAGDYNVLTTEFEQQPYLFTNLYVSAQSFNQAQQPYSLVGVSASGKSLRIPQYPALSAMVQQFVSPENPLYLSPTPLAFFNYTLQAAETARLNIWYYHASKFDMAQLVNDQVYVNQLRRLAEKGNQQAINNIGSAIAEFTRQAEKYRQAFIKKYPRRKTKSPHPILHNTVPLLNLANKNRPHAH